MKLSIITIALTVLYNFYPEVDGHAALYEPPSRNSAFRFGFNTPADYNDMSHNCGSYLPDYKAGSAYCGVCGDPSGAHDMECPSGTYCKKVIVRTYKAGAKIDVDINFAGNHGGLIQFRICPVTDDNKEVTWDCLLKNPLAIQEANGKTIWQEPWSDSEKHDGDVKLHVTLPASMTCKRCVFQWHWTAANYYGTCANGTSGMGCGPQQTYIACADIAID